MLPPGNTRLRTQRHPPDGIKISKARVPRMCRNYLLSLLALMLAGLCACSSEPAKSEKAAAPPDKIQGKAQVVLNETTATDAGLNAEGPSVYLVVDSLHRYRLFFNKPTHVEANKEYVAEGVNAQKAIDAIGDPDQGKNGYPLETSCDHVVRMAWPGLAFDVANSYVSTLRGRIKRYPARPVFLVSQIEPAPPKDPAADSAADDSNSAEISVPADKQKALLIKGPSTLPAPLWE